MNGSRIALPIGAAFACAIAALTVVPRGIEADRLLRAQDDPVWLSDQALDRSFNAAVAAREIEAALKADDADLAMSFLDLARDRKVDIDPKLAKRVEDANSAAAAAARAAGSFAHGLITGEPADLAGFAGTALGDLFLIGDIRDLIREGAKLAKGEQADELILALAGVGLAITAGTYVSAGTAAPARLGVSILKAARRTGRLTAQMGEWLARTMRQVVDLPAIRRAIGGAKVTDPGATVRGVREAVKLEKSEALVKLVSDLGRVQSRAGTQAAMDGLRLARGPGDVARVARLADAKGSRTRAILKLFGAGALFLLSSTWTLSWWILGAIVTLLGFVMSLKRATERATERYCERRRAKKLRSLAHSMTARA